MAVWQRERAETAAGPETEGTDMKVVLGYSGGLDTSIIVPWLRETYQAEVICIKIPVNTRWCILPTKYLKRIPTCEYLRTKNLIILDFQVINIERRLRCIGREHGPP